MIMMTMMYMKVFAEGSSVECRHCVQKLNMARRDKENLSETTDPVLCLLNVWSLIFICNQAICRYLRGSSCYKEDPGNRHIAVSERIVP